ncbi:10840_t:CDS:2, partial [Gigaspora margarita]
EPELITDPQVIEQKLKEGKEGFVSFYAWQDAMIKNGKNMLTSELINN